MRSLLIVVALSSLMSGCLKDPNVEARQLVTPAHHEQCLKAEFDHAAFQICAVSHTNYFYCFYCVDQRGVMYPFEDKTE